MTASDEANDARNLVLELKEQLVRPDSVAVTLAFAWQPTHGALIYVKSVRVNGLFVSLPREGRDTESPYLLPLGSMDRGRHLKVEWELRAFNDLTGIALFVQMGAPGADWQMVPGTQQGRIAAAVLCTGRAEFDVA